MRLVIATIAAMAAGQAAAFGPDLSTRQGCLRELGNILQITQSPFSDRGANWERMLSRAPEEMAERSTPLADIQTRIWALELEFAEQLMAFCNAYPAE